MIPHKNTRNTKCPKCLSTHIYKRTKKHLPSKHEQDKMIKTEHKDNLIIKLDMLNYRCIDCKADFDKSIKLIV